MDCIVGCDQNFRLNEGFTEFLQVNTKDTLDKINDIFNTNMWEQAWLCAKYLNILRNWKDEWNTFISSLERGHVRMTNDLDEFVRNYNDVGGCFAEKLGYIVGFTWDLGVTLKW